MSENVPANTDLLYRLHDRPNPIKAFLGAIQHVLAAFVGIITPSLTLQDTNTETLLCRKYILEGQWLLMIKRFSCQAVVAKRDIW